MELKKGISAVLLAYKEADNLRVLLPEIISAVSELKEEYEVIVVDTEKPLDDTEEVCREYGARYCNQREPHFAGAFKEGISQAGMDKFLIMDSDGSHDPKYIKPIYEKFMRGADLVIGSRYVEGGKSNDSKSSYVMSKILNTAYRAVLGVKAKDLSTDFRMYRTEQLKNVTLSCSNYDVLEEVILKLKLNKPDFSIDETPIVFDKRIYGESKRRLIPFILSYGKTIVRLLFLRISAGSSPDKK